MRHKSTILLAVTLLGALSLHAKAALIVQLDKAGNFGALAATTVTNTGPTIITGGNLGVSPGSSITGFPPGTVTAPSRTTGEPAALKGENGLTIAYNTAAGLAPKQTLSGEDLGGLRLRPGVYFFATSADLGGTLTLNDRHNPNAEFVFQIGTTLTTAAHSSIVTINSDSATGSNVFWQVGSSATIGGHTAFEGNILADTSITMNKDVMMDGSALARHGAVTLDSDSITNPDSSAGPADSVRSVTSSVPEPATTTLVLIGGALLGLRRRRSPAKL